MLCEPNLTQLFCLTCIIAAVVRRTIVVDWICCALAVVYSHLLQW